MLEIDLLGNGPSLNELRINKLLENTNILISCNRIFLHKDFDKFSHKTILCLSDISFKNKEKKMKKLSTICKKIFYPSDYKWTKIESEKLMPYRINREKCKASIVLENIHNYPVVRESCSVLFTIMIPLCLYHKPKKINLYGFDGTYNKSTKYFYKDSDNNDYSWDNKQADNWALLFKEEMKTFLNFCHINKIEVVK